ncbi:ion-transporting P-type ATPase [Blattamonas nauphoetae]|uniref:Ion-transporting P-type ATPase n=1 Tax=Blattamonas nauphoetae TaxID=2049346 RepID=A0ABQ9WXG0_9EUKA|nr:ion-transporting P-type ATPase [Blattamonas nauphoetae]
MAETTTVTKPANWPSVPTIEELLRDKDINELKKLGGTQTIMENLDSSMNGLTDATLHKETRESVYGRNEFPSPKTKSFMRLWGEAFCDFTLIILMVLAAVSLIIAFAVEFGKDLSWLDGTAILITVLIVTIVGAANTYSQEKQFQKLNARQKERSILVTRNGQPTQISIFDLTVGDVLAVTTGDVLPADGLCLEANNINCDEAAMTGESDLIKKSPETHPFMLCGCKVQTGFGRMLVLSVGMNTQFGILKQAVLTAAEERTQTPLQVKLDKLSKYIGYFGFVAAGLTLILLIIFWAISGARESEQFKTGEFWLLLVDYFIIAVTIIVMAVPEGLPLAVTISLAYSMKKMLKDNNLVRVLSSCETMGGATTICSDKTGTLTQNRMKVTAGFFDGVLIENVPTFSKTHAPTTLEHEQEEKQFGVAPAPSPSPSPVPEAASGAGGEFKLDSKYQSLLADAISLNSSADLRIEENGIVDYLGNVTECAMLLFIHERGINYKTIRKNNHLAQTYPFSSERKRMTVIADMGEFYRVFTKGASEVVSSYCTTIYSSAGNKQIDDDERANIDDMILSMASNGLRTIALAYKDIPKASVDTKDADSESGPFPDDAPPEDELILLGITGIKDPLRPEVPLAIDDCNDAKIVVRMVTGDNIITAMHIARECGIYDPVEGIAMEGPVFRDLLEEDRLRVLPKLQVLARSSPIDKQILVDGLQKLGHVVAVTGDGTNDAPALSKADVGFAMGITGTEVAKDAAAIIITDDNFASIVKAVMWGRNVYDNIRKFLQFQLTVNVSAIVIAVTGAIFAITPLKAIQMLWVNLIMDSLAALALATETPTRQLLKRPPYGRTDSLICPSMWRNIILTSIYESAIVLMLLFLWGPEHPIAMDPSTGRPNKVTGCPLLAEGDEIKCSDLMFPQGLCREFAMDPTAAVFSREHFSMIFNVFIWMQVFAMIPSRKCYNEVNFFEHIFSNWVFFAIAFIIAALQVIIMLVPGLTHAFSVMYMHPLLWLWTILFGLGVIPFRALVHMFKVPEPFNGEVPIKYDPGAPAGVYRKGEESKIPGCTLRFGMGVKEREEKMAREAEEKLKEAEERKAKRKEEQEKEDKKKENKKKEEKKEVKAQETKKAEPKQDKKQEELTVALVEAQPAEKKEEPKVEEKKEEVKPVEKKEEAQPVEEKKEEPKQAEPVRQEEEVKEEEATQKAEDAPVQEEKKEEPVEEKKEEEQPKEEEKKEEEAKPVEEEKKEEEAPKEEEKKEEETKPVEEEKKEEEAPKEEEKKEEEAPKEEEKKEEEPTAEAPKEEEAKAEDQTAPESSPQTEQSE